MRSLRSVVIVLASSSSIALAGSNYKKPDVAVPQNWQSPVPWHQASPLDSLPKNAWWEIFTDRELNQYEECAMTANQTLKAAIARLVEARASAVGEPPPEWGGYRALRSYTKRIQPPIHAEL